MSSIPPDFVIELARSDIYDYLNLRSPDLSSLQGTSLSMYTRLDAALDEIDGLSEADKQGFREAMLQAIETSVIPAYGLMLDYFDRVEPLATDDAGVWKLPDGDEYYAYMLRQETSTDLTPEEIHEIGLAEVERIQQEMYDALIAMGYAEDVPFGELMQRAVDDFGYYDLSAARGQGEYVGEIERAIEEVDRRVADVFDLKPHYGVVVIPGEYGGYYSPGAPDGSRPGSYHVSLRGQWRPKYGLYTVAYHETIPGHHYQIATAQGLDLPDFRNHMIKILELRQRAMDALGDQFDLKEFHNVILGNGSLPLEILEQVVEDWLEAKLNQ